MKEKIKLGKYKHYKGGIYEIIGIAKYSEKPEEELVVYKHDDGQLWVRPIKIFQENVETENYKGPRFEYLGK